MAKRRKLETGEHRYNKQIVKPKNFESWKENKEYDRHKRVWVKKEVGSFELTVVVGDYKNEKFDIVMRIVVSKDEYAKHTNEEWLNIIKGYAVKNLNANKQGGFAAMIEKNTNEGIEAVETDKAPSDFNFERFLVRGKDLLKEATHKRKVQYKLGDKSDKNEDGQ